MVDESTGKEPDWLSGERSQWLKEQRRKQTVALLGIPIAVIIAGVFLAAMIPTAWVFTILWRWFVVPIEPGVYLSGQTGQLRFSIPAISVAQAYGLMLLFALLRAKSGGRLHTLESQWSKDNAKKSLTYTASTLLVAPFVSLFVAWLVKSWFL